MSWTPPAHWVEVQYQLKKSMSVTLDSTGNGVIIFQPDGAHQRWDVSSVVVSTNQASTSTTIPIATLALNTISNATLSPGNSRGSTWSGNQDTFTGSLDVSPCDFMSVIFTPPPGATPTQVATLSGVICTAIVTGAKYTRRA
jgi:hypothetical protein